MTTAPALDDGPWTRGARASIAPLLAFAGGLALLDVVLETAPVGWLGRADIALGALACLTLLARRRRPYPVGVVTAVAAAVVTTAGVANMVALYAVARYRPLGPALLLAAADVAAGWLFWVLHPGNSTLVLTLVTNTAIAAAVVAWGALLQAQRRLVDSYRERAERAEAEQQLRAQRIRIAERTRIAREMHDAVANRISLVALHAGGLMVTGHTGDDDVRRAAETIRSAATAALEDLRRTIGVLRTDEPDSIEQPGADRLDDLVRDSRRAGQPVELAVDPTVRTDVPASLGRDVYRIVQEGLTNAQKHAPGAPTTVAVTRTDRTLAVRVVNGLVGEGLAVPGAGAGLIGLQERADLAGGTIRHGTTADGTGFELHAELPWT